MSDHPYDEPSRREDGAGSVRDSESFKKAVELHYRGVEGDREAVASAYAVLEALYSAYPGDYLVKAYLGSVLSLQGRDALDPVERFDKTLKGLKLLDQAVASEPENNEIRILRGNICRRLPETYFHRTATAVEDFEYLIGRYERAQGIFSPGFYRTLLQDLAVAYEVLDRPDQVKAVRRKLKKKPTYRKSDRRSEAARELAEAKRQYTLALAGDRQAAGRALDFFTRAMQEDPANAMLLTYRADCNSLLGRTSEEPAEMFASAIAAMTLFDKAVKLDPENVRVRLMRAAQSLRLPEAFFRRTATALVDLEYLASRYEIDRTVFPAEVYHRVLYHLSHAHARLRQEEEASCIRSKLTELNPDPEILQRLKPAMRERPHNGHDPITLDRREEYYEEAKRLHDQGVAGDRTAAMEALILWRRAYEEDRNDPLAEAYLGSCQALAGRDAPDSNEIFTHTISGLIHLNKAVETGCDNPQVRALRGFVAYSLPESFFHLTQRAIEDFECVRSMLRLDDSVRSRELYLEASRCLAGAYKRSGKPTEAARIEDELAETASGLTMQSSHDAEIQLYPIPGLEEDEDEFTIRKKTKRTVKAGRTQ